jgi:N-acyl-L-homoserine lactone synthetase
VPLGAARLQVSVIPAQKAGCIDAGAAGFFLSGAAASSATEQIDLPLVIGQSRLAPDDAQTLAPMLKMRGGRLASEMTFLPPLVLDTSGGNASKNFPLALRIYCSTSDLGDLFRLRYRAFREAGWIESNPEGRFSDRFDRLPSTFAVGAFHKGNCVGSVRLAFGGLGYERCSMPCEVQFPQEIAQLADADRGRFIEFSRMAVEPSLTNRSFRTTLYASLVRAGFILSYAANVDVALIAVHKKISLFYQHMCGFRVVARSESYVGIAEPTHLLAREFHALDARRQQRNAFFSFSEEEIARARRTLNAAQCQVAA